MTATFYVGDAVTVMNTLPEKSVDLILTSPPFLALRSYLPSDHPDKALEGGSQSTPGEYIDWLLDVVEACARVLAPHGSLCFELGDTYAGSGGAGGDYNDGSLREGQPLFEGSAKFARHEGRNDWEAAHPINRVSGTRGAPGGKAWPLAKSLSLIPETFRFAMVYGHNPHTGRTTPPWRLRNVIRWVRPNPPVGALGDKFRPATSELMVFCKAKDRFFDLDAVRMPISEWTQQYADRPVPISPNASASNTQSMGSGTRTSGLAHESKPVKQQGAPPLDWWNIPLLDGEPQKGGPKPKPLTHGPDRGTPQIHDPRDGRDTKERSSHEPNPAGAPPLDWWNIPPGGYPGAHYAVWPPELLVKPIKAMCPEKVCRRCGEPSRRIVGEAEYIRPDGSHAKTLSMREGTRADSGVNQWLVPGHDTGNYRAVRPTLGFSDCGHDDYRPGLVLDPFAGSGTTLSVATGHGRDAIGIDLDSRNYELALERVGPLILQRGEIRDGTGPPD